MPDGWEAHRLKYNYREIDHRSQTGDEEMLSVSHITGITPRSQKNVTMFMAESNIGLKICEPDDIVVNTMWAWMAAMGVSAYSGIVSPSYGVYKPINEIYNPKYLNLLLRTNEYQAEYMRRSTGIRPSRLRLYPDKFLDIRFILPPRDEQDKIVHYLDWKVSQINKLINAKRRQIELLQEQKQTVVNEAVTRKNEHWIFGRIGRYYEVTLGKMLQPNKKSEDDSMEYYMCAANIKWSGVTLNPLKQMWFSPQELSAYRISLGDLLVTEGGDVGVSSIWKNEINFCCIQNSVHLVTSSAESIKYLYYWLFNLKNLGWIDSICSKATIAHFTKEKLSNAPLSLPPRKEQDLIVGYLDEQFERIEIIIRKLNDEIALLTEYRTRLISDVVTGKMDVRDVVVPEYETVVETVDTIDDDDKEMTEERGGENNAE